MRGLSKATVVGIVALAFAASANAGVTFFQFTADPDAALDPAEFVYDPITGFSHGPGALGNNAGTSPGLGGVVTGGLPGVPFSPPSIGGSGQILQDLSMVLTGFVPVGSATVGATTITQPLSGGTFSIYHTDGVNPPLVLLEGTTDSALLTERNTAEASVLSGAVVYTGGLLFSNFPAAGLLNTGTFSFALSGLDGTFGVVPVNQEFRLAAFTSDGTGSFDANVPEPTMALGAAALLGFLAAGHSRRRA